MPPLNANNVPDGDIAGAVLDGDINAFEVLLRRHSANIFKIVSRRIPTGDVETVAQEIFLTAFRSLGTYAGRQPFDHWLARIARRRCCDYWRNKERRNRIIVNASPDDRCAWIELAADQYAAQTHASEANHQNTRAMVRAALQRLSAETRHLIESIYFEEMPLKEVAEDFGWSLVKTKVKAYRARKYLRKIIENINANGG